MRHFLPLLIILLLSASCADDLGRRDIFATTSEQVVISFSVDNVVLSRSGDGEFDEAAINHAYLLFYPSDKSDFSGSPAAVVKADVPETGRLRFNMPVSLQENTSYKLVAIANADDYCAAASDFGTYLKSKIDAGEITSLSDILLQCDKSITSSSVSYLPMKGTVKDNTPFSFSKTGGTVYVNVALSFRRLVSRIDVSNLASNFTLEGVVLCNWRDAVSLGDHPASQPGEIQGKLSVSENTEGSSSSLTFAAPSDGGKSLNGALYCFPSSSDSPAPGDQSTTAIIIKGKYGSEESSYYRVNLGLNDDGGANLDPNTRYTVSITAVNGNGCDSSEAAYSATSEAQIVTAVVEDWDIEGGNYVMDDKGHVLGVSKAELEFDCDDTQPKQIKVLCSKDLDLSAEFIAAEGTETPSDAFIIPSSLSSPISSSPISTLTIKPKGPNSSPNTLSGKCHISATKNGSECLWFDITLNQRPSADKPYVPVFPQDRDYALVPLVGPDRVKVTHDTLYGGGSKPINLIEINGFDPDCFNSFIDIPFCAYVKENSGYTVNSISSSDLSWPLEGRMTEDEPEKYYYCANSFKTPGPTVYSKTKGETSVTVKNGVYVDAGGTFYFSVGAMGPDDPAIERSVTYSVTDKDKKTTLFKYTLLIKPRDVIVDDVVLTDSENNSWLIFDRNVQDLSPNQTYNSFTGRKDDSEKDDKGQKWQAYNYSWIGNNNFAIPGKLQTGSSTSPFPENTHKLYWGKYIAYDAQGKYKTSINTEKGNWLAKYVYSQESFVRTSPFYEVSDTAGWILPSQSVLELCRSKMTVSKMRMFLVSDVPAKNGTKKIPVCCYWPFHGNLNNDINTFWYGYFASNTDTPLAIIYCDKTDVKKIILNPATGYKGLTRLVRSLTPEELTNYKNNFLGYDPSKQCLLKPCHPDTYSSTSQGWIDK